ncbi:MAG: transglutaminase domain-containing protein [Gemmataceae bacterium]
MSRLLVAFVLTALILPALPAADPPPRFVIEERDTQRVVAELTYDVACPKLTVAKWLVFVPVAPELPGQTKLKTTLSPKGEPVADLSKQARPLLVARVPADTPARKTALPIKVTYEASLRSRTLKPLVGPPPTVPPLSARDRTNYTADSDTINWKTDALQVWMDEAKYRRQPKEGEVEFARRVFLGLTDTFKYGFDPKAETKASAVCRSEKADCGGLSVLFTAVMRANGVPARVRYGRWAKSAKPDEKLDGHQYLQWHVKAEFYAAGVGWVPVDLAMSLGFTRPADRLTQFGKDDGTFLTLHVDPVLVVDAGPFGKQTVALMQRPVWWVTGDGKADPTTEDEGWTVRAVKGR